MKETEEEIGITEIKFEKWIKLRSEGKHQFFAQWFKATIDKPIEEFTVGEDEVAKIKWWKEEEIKEGIKSNPKIFLHSVKRIINGEY